MNAKLLFFECTGKLLSDQQVTWFAITFSASLMVFAGRLHDFKTHKVSKYEFLARADKNDQTFFSAFAKISRKMPITFILATATKTPNGGMPSAIIPFPKLLFLRQKNALAA